MLLIGTFSVAETDLPLEAPSPSSEAVRGVLPEGHGGLFLRWSQHLSTIFAEVLGTE